MMKKMFGRSWRTTLLGYLSAAGLVAVDALSTGGSVTALTVGKAVAVAVFGRIAKDAAVASAP
jgi:hypothetical protein